MIFSKLPFAFRLLAIVVAIGAIAPLPHLSAQAIPFDARVTAVAVDPIDPNRVYASTAGGLLKTDNRGVSWEQLPIFPLGSRQPALQQVAFDLANTATIYVWVRGRTGDPLGGAWRSTNRGAAWERIVGATTFPAGSDLDRLLVAPTNGSILYASVVEPNGSSATYRSANGGSTWTRTSSADVDAISTGNADTVYRADFGEVFRSTDGARTWFRIGQTRDASEGLNGINAIAIAPNNPNVMVATMTGSSGSSNGIFRSTDGGTSWTRVRQGNFIGATFSVKNPSQVLVGDCCGLSIYFSNDGGLTFADVQESLEGAGTLIQPPFGRTAFDYAASRQLIHGLSSSLGGGVAMAAAPEGLWRRLQGTYTPTAVPSTLMPEGELLSGDTSEGRATIGIVAAEGSPSTNFTIQSPTSLSDGVTVNIVRDGTDPANPQPSISVRRNAQNLAPGDYQAKVVLPVSGAANQTVTIERAFRVVDQPESGGVYLGRGVPSGVPSSSVYSLAVRNGVAYVGSSAILYTLDAHGNVQTVAGTGTSGYAGDGGPAKDAQISWVEAIAFAPDGTLYFLDGLNRRIRRIAPNGTISTFAGNPAGSTSITNGATLDSVSFLLDPGLAVDNSGNLLLAHSNRIWRVEGNVFRAIAGGGSGAPDSGRLATEVSLSGVHSLAVDGQGRIVFATSSQLFRILPNQALEHLAGATVSSEVPGSTDARQVRLEVDAFTLTPEGIYLMDGRTFTVKRVNPDRAIEDIALNGMLGSPSSCTGARYAPSASTVTDGLAMLPDGTLLLGQSGLPRLWIPQAASANSQPPAIPAEGIVNAASFSRRLSPGSLASVLGTDVAASQAAAPALPLPAQLGGSVTCIAGHVAPLVFSSPLQLNLQIPFGLQPGVHTLRGFNALGGSPGVPVELLESSPEIFRSNGRAVVINPDGSLNNTGNGVSPGQVVVAYLTGIGEVTPSVTTGGANPLAPLAVPTQSTSATVGGVPATVHYLGMTPGFAGLAQANVEIPALAPGEHPIVLRVGNQASEALSITVK